MFPHTEGVTDDNPERYQIAVLVRRIANEAVDAYCQDMCQALTGHFDRNERTARMSTLLRSWVDATLDAFEAGQRARAALDE